MKNKYCLPIIKETSNEVIEKLRLSDANYAFFEIWLDYIKDVTSEFIDEITTGYKGQLVFVFRRQNLEPTQMVPEKRLSIIDKLIAADCLIDLDISTQLDDLSHINKLNGEANLITSFHDYQKTPDETELKEIITKMKVYTPRIIKIAAMCNSESDAVSLLRTQLSLKSENQKHIIIGMGEYGKITRIFGTLWGNELVFIPETNEEQSAPGQLSKDQFEKIMKELEK